MMVITQGVDNVHSRQRRRPIRIWVPIVPVLVVLSPLLVPALVIGMAVVGVNPARGLLAVWRVVWSARGLQVHVQDHDTMIRIIIG
jgi:hypothetical protein